MYRVEDKYLCTERDMLLLESRVRSVLLPDRYSVDGSYRVTSLYFDDMDDSHLTEADDGVSFRNKYRIRLYDRSSDVIKLEVKYKAYDRVYKKSRPVSRDVADRLIRGEYSISSAGGGLSMDDPVTLFDLAIRKDLLRPRVVVEYDRSAYVYEPGNVRITFDRNIRFSSDLRGFMSNECSYSPACDNDRILEVKYDEFLPGFIARILEGGNMIRTSYSKYGLSRMRSEVYTCL